MRARIVAAAVGLILCCPLLAFATDTFRITVSAANVRKEPSTTSPIIAIAPQDSSLVVVGRSGQWVQVEAVDRNGTKVTGYILGNLGIVERTPDQPANKLTSAPAVPSSPSSDSLPAKPNSSATATVDDSSSRGADVRVPLVPQSSPGGLGGQATDRNEWRRRLQEATEKRSRSRRLALIGGGVAAFGMFVVPAMVPADSASAAKSGLLVGLGGLGTMFYGVYQWHLAKEAIDDLDRDGRMKGYLAIAPTRGGVQASATFTW